eukprot:Colp12_sorted_trinity150504_noHs@24450
MVRTRTTARGYTASFTKKEPVEKCSHIKAAIDWTIDGYGATVHAEPVNRSRVLYSPTKRIGGVQWGLRIFPFGSDCSGNSTGIYLYVDGALSFSVTVKFRFTIHVDNVLIVDSSDTSVYDVISVQDRGFNTTFIGAGTQQVRVVCHVELTLSAQALEYIEKEEAQTTAIFNQLFQNGTCYDAFLLSSEDQNDQDKGIPVHKALIGLYSEKLGQLVDGGEGEMPVIVVPGVRKTVLQSLVEFMYKGTCNFSDDSEDLLKAAKDWGISDLYSACLANTLTNENALDTLKIATENNFPEVVERCLELTLGRAAHILENPAYLLSVQESTEAALDLLELYQGAKKVKDEHSKKQEEPLQTTEDTMDTI